MQMLLLIIIVPQHVATRANCELHRVAQLITVLSFETVIKLAGNFCICIVNKVNCVIFLKLKRVSGLINHND